MQKRIIMIALALVLPLTAFASPGDWGGNHEDHIAHKLERLTKELTLTADQQSQLQALFKEKAEKSKALHEETRAGVQKILTAEQFTKWEELKKQHHEHWKDKHENKSKDSSNDQVPPATESK